MSRSAPVCTFCKRSGAGVQFAIFNPRFQPFGTACTDCEALVSTANLRKLRAEAVAEVDAGQLGERRAQEVSQWARLCTRAIDGDVDALTVCVNALRKAVAQP